MTDLFPRLTTRRLLLRQFGQSDLANVFAGLSHPDVIRHYGVHYETIEQTQEQINWFAAIEKNDTGIWWAICSAETGKFYGAVGLNDLIREHDRAEMGYWLLPAYWQKGIMREAIPLICAYGFSKLNLHRIQAVVETDNIASQNVLINSGFAYEGTMQGCERKNGKYISLMIYARLQSALKTTQLDIP